MNWEIVLVVAFNTIGLLEFVKGFFKHKEINSNAWRGLQVVFAFGLAVVFATTPAWIMNAVSGLSLSQLGFDIIVETVKKKVQK